MPMSPRLLRPRSTLHPEAADWKNRVIANGGTVSGATLAAVSKFCRDIDAAGIRAKVMRLNLFAGENLSAALVPLYRAESSTASARGNATDTSNNFVGGDFNNTGAASGLTGNGSTKFLNTGLPANTFTGNNQHFAVGLRANNASGTNVVQDIAGAFDGSQAHALSARRGTSGSGSLSLLSATMGNYANSNASFGDAVFNSNLAVGNIVAAWPTMYRNATATGSTAISSNNYPSAHALLVFASNNTGGGAFGHSNVRLNWYSFGLTMTAAEVVAFNSALNTFNTTLART